MVDIVLIVNLCRKFLCFSQEERLETEGTPVPVSVHTLTLAHSQMIISHSGRPPLQANTPLFINHCKTNQNLAVHEEWTYKYYYTIIMM